MVATAPSRTPPWLLSRRGCRGRRLSSSTENHSVRNLSSLRKEVVLALFGGGQQLCELRRAAQRRQQRILLQGSVGAIFPLDGGFEQPQSHIFLATEGHVSCE